MRIIRYVIKTIKKNIFIVLNFFIFIYHRVECGKNLKITGILNISGVKGRVSIGNNVTIHSGSYDIPIGYPVKTSFWTTGDGRIIIGDSCGISNATFCSMSCIKLGNNVLLGGGVKLYDTDFHSLQYKIRRNIDFDNDRKTKPIIIENDVFIGAGSIILKGTIIGEHSVIGAGAVVSGEIPPNQIWAGNPAQFIKNIGECDDEATLDY